MTNIKKFGAQVFCKGFFDVCRCSIEQQLLLNKPLIEQ